MLRQSLVILVLVIICCGEEYLTCMRSQTPLNTTLGTAYRRGKKGSIGPKGDKGEPGMNDNDKIDMLAQQVETLQNQVQALLSEKPPTNCSEIYTSNRTSGFYKTSSDAFKCNCKMEFCDLSSAAQGNFVGSSIRRGIEIPFDSIRGHAVVITGKRTSSSNVFVIDLSTRIAGEVPLHFKLVPGVGVIVRNTLQNNIWGAEERSLDISYPFARNLEFKLKISVDSQGFHVFLNNEHLLDYNHRYQQISDIQVIGVLGGAEIYRIWFE